MSVIKEEALIRESVWTTTRRGQRVWKFCLLSPSGWVTARNARAIGCWQSALNLVNMLCFYNPAHEVLVREMQNLWAGYIWYLNPHPMNIKYIVSSEKLNIRSCYMLHIWDAIERSWQLKRQRLYTFTVHSFDLVVNFTALILLLAVEWPGCWGYGLGGPQTGHMSAMEFSCGATD